MEKWKCRKMVPTQIKRIYGPPLRPVAFSNFVTRMIAICSPMTLCRIISCISQFAPFQPVNQFVKRMEIKTVLNLQSYIILKVRYVFRHEHLHILDSYVVILFSAK
jgi:hypothetical protein